MKRLFAVVFFMAFVVKVYSQPYVFKHFTQLSGLPGNLVYCSSQDKDGFIWFGTENGACRFDGKNFVTFTTYDGLTDNEVLEVYSDKFGRTWFACFTGSLCYYYKGKIYNYKNDNRIDKEYIPTRLSFNGFFEDRVGTVWFSGDRLFAYNTDQTLIHDVSVIKNRILRDNTSFMLCSLDGDVCFLLYSANSPEIKLIRFVEGKQVEKNINGLELQLHSGIEKTRITRNFAIYNNIFRIQVKTLEKFIIQNSILKRLVYEFDHEISRVNGTLDSSGYWLSSYNSGALYADAEMNIKQHVLENERISNVLEDRQGNVWFTTLSNGVFCLPKSRIKLMTIKEGGLHNNNLKSINIVNGRNLCVGYSDGYIQYITSGHSNPPVRVIMSDVTPNNIKKAKWNSQGDAFFLSDRGISKVDKSGIILNYRLTGALKDFELFNDTTLLCANNSGVFITYAHQPPDSIIQKKRITAIAKDENTSTYYLASTDTMFVLQQNKSLTPFIKYDHTQFGRVNEMTVSNHGVLFVATYNNGLIYFKNDSLIVINENNGLLSNQCRKLHLVNDSLLWLVTMSGISKIEFDKKLTGYRIRNFTFSEGFSSNSITGICSSNNSIYLSTDNGLNYFSEIQLDTSADHSVEITYLLINNIPIELEGKAIQVSRNQSIKIGYSGISFTSADRLSFRYRLIGVSKDWAYTHLNELEFPNLSPGEYEFEVYAINKDLKDSTQPATISFIVLPAFWQTWWFKIVVATVLGLVFYLLMRQRVRLVKKAEAEKTAVNKKFAELRLEAIRAQMEPHFIFNCLNAIQHFNIREDYLSAQHFMAEFARLIRKTLNHSQRDFTVLEDEIELLEIYIKLEKLRFEDSFGYEIEMSEEIKTKQNLIMVPSLIFQPYVENAINHGLRFLKDDKGILKLQFIMERDRLICVIDDNGIGVDASRKIKFSKVSKNESYGINLTRNRISIINKIHELDISQKIIDKSTLEPTNRGTRVEISLPIILN